MSFRQVTCILLGCDYCEDPWSNDEYGQPHFDSEEQALAYAARNGWISLDCAMVCPNCAAKADCAATGHQWSEWMDALEVPDVIPHRHRYCEHCTTSEYDPPFDELLLLKRIERQLATTEEPKL